MEINEDLKIEIFAHVYEPAEDSYLLIRAIEVKEGEKVLDMGCGCGIVALHMAKHGCSVTAADINDDAVKNTRWNASQNELNIKVIKSDLFLNIDEKFDVIAFNPPYLPLKGEDISWAGGKEGIEVIRRFLKDAKNHLKEEGRIYIVMSSLNNIAKIKKEFENIYEFKEIAKESFFFEKIYVYRLKLRGRQCYK